MLCYLVYDLFVLCINILVGVVGPDYGVEAIAENGGVAQFGFLPIIKFKTIFLWCSGFNCFGESCCVASGIFRYFKLLKYLTGVGGGGAGHEIEGDCISGVI